MKRNSNRSALAALALAGGLWAWRNRDKIQGWLGRQRQQFGSGQIYTGQTRRIEEAEMPGNDGPSRSGIYNSPEI